MNNLSADRDSLVALDALLRIRESGAESSASSQNNNMKNGGSTYFNAQSSMRPSLNNLLPINPGVILPQVGNPCFNQLAAVHAAAAAGWPRNPLFASHQTVAIQPAEGTNAGPIKKRGKKRAVEVSIRQERIDEALRSKPQRGRKRDDLNDKERLELTRTRNREHAKSTRIRKKARYQELLDCEAQFEQFQVLEGLKAQRYQKIQNFLSVRQAMLANVKCENNSENCAISGNQDSGESSSDKLKKESKALSSRQVEYESLVSQTVGNLAEFRFEYNIPGGSQPEAIEAMARMRDWDQAVANRVAGCYGSGSERSLVYGLVGGNDGIALSNDGNGFARVQVVMNAEETNLILSGILVVQFAQESSEISSVTWTTVQDHCQVPRASSVPLAVSPSRRDMLLSSHLVHPSVVSLDPEKMVHETEDVNAPGVSSVQFGADSFKASPTTRGR